MGDTHMLRVNQACKVTELSRNTLYRYMRNGTLAYTEIEGVRFLKASDVEALVEDKEEPVTSFDDVTLLREEIRLLRQEVSHLRVTIEHLSDAVTIENPIPNAPQVTQRARKGYNSSYERRSNEARDKVFAVLNNYRDTKQPLATNIIMCKQAGVGRATFAKYRKEWEANEK